MKTTVVAIALLATMLASTKMAAQTVELRQRADATGCAVTPIACGQTLDGVLAPGDCTVSSDGTFVDFYEFDGRSGDIVDVLVWPVDSTMTNPRATLLPPKGDASSTPFVSGGRGVWTSYVISSSGKWAIGVGTSDLFSSGHYRVAVFCVKDDNPSAPQSCITQEMVCGQTYAWTLSSQSCRFSDGPNRVYGSYEIYAAAGDTLSIKQTSSAFAPLFGFYAPDGSLLLSSTLSGHDGNMVATIQKTGLYGIAATSQAELAVGGYTLRVDCNTLVSGCTPPTIIAEPGDQLIQSGKTVRISAGATAVGAIKYSWFDVSAGLPTLLADTNTGTLTLSTVSKSVAVQVIAQSPCGQVSSRIARINVISKGRAVRH